MPKLLLRFGLILTVTPPNAADFLWPKETPVYGRKFKDASLYALVM